MSSSRRKYTSFFGAAALLTGGLLASAATPADALTTYDVTSTVDGAPGSLRAQLTAANADGDDSVINLPEGAEITLDVCGLDDTNAAGDLDATSADQLTIQGNGATIRQTCSNDRVLHAGGSGSVSLWEVTITGGNGVMNGGGIWLTGTGTLSITLSTVRGNSADNVGGGVSASGTDGHSVFVFDSTFTENTAFNGGAIFSGNPLIVNSTISGNSVEHEGAAVFGSPTLLYATVNDNVVTTEWHLNSQFSTGTLTAFGSVIGGGTPGVPNCVLMTETVSQGYNVEEQDTCGLDDATDQVDTPAQLGGLADNGGPTLTHLPADGSPLIDNIPAANCDLDHVADQRNVARPQGSGCDTGSVEVQQASTPGPSDGDAPVEPGSDQAVRPRFTG
jgi:hypothetical protein